MSKGKWKSSWYISHHISISPQFHINWQIFRKVICIWWCMVNPIMTWAAPSAAAQWFQVPKTRQQINSPDLISGIFFKHLSVDLQYLRVRCHCIFIFKICQTVANHKYDQTISRFFKNIFFGEFLSFYPTVRTRLAKLTKMLPVAIVKQTWRILSLNCNDYFSPVYLLHVLYILHEVHLRKM